MKNLSKKTIILRSQDTERIDTPWGGLTWYSSGKLGNSTDLTIGRCIIKPGMSNPFHSHPNSTELLIVMAGTIMHTSDNGETMMEVGDTITVPVDFPHQARNIGDTDAVLMVVFPTADRQVENE